MVVRQSIAIFSSWAGARWLSGCGLTWEVCVPSRNANAYTVSMIPNVCISSMTARHDNLRAYLSMGTSCNCEHSRALQENHVRCKKITCSRGKDYISTPCLRTSGARLCIAPLRRVYAIIRNKVNFLRGSCRERRKRA